MLKAILLIPSICQATPDSLLLLWASSAIAGSKSCKWCKMFKDVQRLQIELNSQSGKGLDNSQKPKLPDCFEVTIAEHFLSEMFCAWIDLISWSYSSRSTAKIPKEGASAAQQHIVTTCKAQSRGFRPEAAIVRGLLKQNTWYFPLSREAPQKTNVVAVGDNHHNLLEGSSSIPLSSFSWIALPQSFRLLARHPNHPSKKKSVRTVLIICILRCSDTFSISSRSMPKTVGLCLGLSLEPDNRTCYLDLPWSTSHNWLEKHGMDGSSSAFWGQVRSNWTTRFAGVGLLAHWIPTASETFCRITRANGKICNTYEYIWKQYITRNI